MRNYTKHWSLENTYLYKLQMKTLLNFFANIKQEKKVQFPYTKAILLI